MKYLKNPTQLIDAEDAEDAVRPTELLESRLAELQTKLDSLPEDTPPRQRAAVLLEIGYVLLDLERKDELWNHAREAFDLTVPVEAWEEAVQACDLMSQSDHPDAMKALAHGIWLAVTYPIDPELSVAVLQRFVDETPPNADGAAVAAAVARYLVDLRAQDKQREDLQFFTGQLLGDVARRHSQVDSQDLFDFWVERLELNDVGKILTRLGTMLDVIVQDDWWYDRDALRARIPAG